MEGIIVTNVVSGVALFLSTIVLFISYLALKKYNNKMTDENEEKEKNDFITTTLADYKFDGVLGDIFNNMLTVVLTDGKDGTGNRIGLFICGWMGHVKPSDLFDIPLREVTDSEKNAESIEVVFNDVLEMETYKRFVECDLTDKFSLILLEGYLLLNIIEDTRVINRRVFKVV